MSIKQQAIFAPQPTTLRGSPTQLSVDAKGERIAYGTGKSVYLRSIDDPSSCRQYTAHTAAVNVARISPSGYYVASGDVSGKVRVWDCAGEDMVTKGEFPIISGPIKDLAWDGESKRIIAVGEGRERFGHCITFDTGNSVGEITGHSKVINSVAIRQQRPYRAATASDDMTVVFFHGAPFKYNLRIEGSHSNFVHAVAFSPDGSYFVTAGADRNIFLFDGREGTLVKEIRDAHKGSIFALSWSPDSKRFVTASADQTVKLWDAQEGVSKKTWSIGPGSSFNHHQVGVVWIPRAEELIISLSLNGDLNYLSPSSDDPVRVVQGHQQPINTLGLSSSQQIFSGSSDGRVCSWDLSKGLAERVPGDGHTNWVSGLLSSSSDSVFTIGWDDKLRTIAQGTFTSAVATDGQPRGIAALGSSLVAVVTHKELQVYNTSRPTASLEASLPLKFEPTALAAASTDEIAVAGQNSSIHIFRYSSGSITETQTFSLTRSFASALAYSPDGKHFAAGGTTGQVILYETKGYAEKTDRWAFNTARIEGIAWNEKGTHVATASLDTNLIVYSVEKPSSYARFRNAHMGGVKAVKWTSEKGLVSAGFDAAVKTWEVALP